MGGKSPTMRALSPHGNPNAWTVKRQDSEACSGGRFCPAQSRPLKSGLESSRARRIFTVGLKNY